MRRTLELKASGHSQPEKSDESKSVLDGADQGRKRKQPDDNVENNTRNVKFVAPACGDVLDTSSEISTVSSKAGPIGVQRVPLHRANHKTTLKRAYIL